MTLDQVIADWRGDAAVLRRRGNEHDAELIEQMCREVADASEDFTRWLNEGDAYLRSGHGPEWLRARFPMWEREGHARMNGRKREYRQVVIPRRADPATERELGRHAGAAV